MALRIDKRCENAFFVDQETAITNASSHQMDVSLEVHMKIIKSRLVLILLALLAITIIVILTRTAGRGDSHYPTTPSEAEYSLYHSYEYDPPYIEPISYTHLFPTAPGYAAALYVGDFIFAPETYSAYEIISHPRWEMAQGISTQLTIAFEGVPVAPGEELTMYTFRIRAEGANSPNDANNTVIRHSLTF